MKAVVHDLLKQYLVVEGQFQNGHYDKCVSMLREKNKETMAAVVATIFSHSQTTKKNLLVTQLIDHLWSHEPGLTDELATILKELTMLNRSENAKVALRARQVCFSKLGQIIFNN
jgi:acetyl-CoA carboxylase/biotin carboxylase 1